jgi:hypothetical protein
MFPFAFARRAAHRQSGWRQDRRAAGVPRRRGTRNAGKESESSELQVQLANGIYIGAASGQSDNMFYRTLRGNIKNMHLQYKKINICNIKKHVLKCIKTRTEMYQNICKE